MGTSDRCLDGNSSRTSAFNRRIMTFFSLECNSSALLKPLTSQPKRPRWALQYCLVYGVYCPKSLGAITYNCVHNSTGLARAGYDVKEKWHAEPEKKALGIGRNRGNRKKTRESIFCIKHPINAHRYVPSHSTKPIVWLLPTVAWLAVCAGCFSV